MTIHAHTAYHTGKIGSGSEADITCTDGYTGTGEMPTFPDFLYPLRVMGILDKKDT